MFSVALLASVGAAIGIYRTFHDDASDRFRRGAASVAVAGHWIIFMLIGDSIGIINSNPDDESVVFGIGIVLAITTYLGLWFREERFDANSGSTIKK